MKNEKWERKEKWETKNEKQKKGLSDYICDWVCDWMILPNDRVKEFVSEKASKTFSILSEMFYISNKMFEISRVI